MLGAARSLARAELHALLPSSLFVPLSGSCMFLEESRDVSAETLQEVAGGVVKIAEVVGEVAIVTPGELAEILLSSSIDQQKITFGVSRYDGDVVSLPWLREIKAQLSRAGKKARFISSPDGILSSVVVQKEHMQELVVAKRGDHVLIGLTATVQDFEAWNKRDYGRPYADPKSGMLPPKVARMAVNIALKNSEIFQGKPVQVFTILDPFCGMGTILAEALLRGCHVIGSDQSEEVIAKARKNLEWLTHDSRNRGTLIPGIELPSVQLLVSDATHVSHKLRPNSIDAIVTEPHMGTPALGERRVTDPEKIRNVVKGLEKLYIGALRDWVDVLKPRGNVVIALPQFSLEGKTYFVKKVVDSCEKLGYTMGAGPIEYSRPQAVVRRQFFVFTKN